MRTDKKRREKNTSLSSNGIRKRTSSRLQLKQRVSETGQQLNKQNQDVAVSFTKEKKKKKKNITMRKLECVKPLIPSPKIKLQFFPRDADTRMGLEKDGHNPYLELTLRPRKKINSVIKHLDSKWGTSSIALGKLMLLPCNTGLQYPASCQRWTLNDSGVSAGDVYSALGSPAIFRLRYGWFSEFDIGSLEVPHPSTRLEGFSLHKSTGKDEKRQSPEESKQNDDDIGSEFDIGSFEVPHPPNRLEGFSLHKSTGRNEKKQSTVASGQSGQNHDDKLSLNPQAMDDEVRVNCSIPLKSTPQTDSLVDISIGGLFSDASLQDMLKTCDPKSTPTTSVLQPDQLVSESLDAFIAAKMNPQFHLRGQIASSRTQSSILDAEETCHAFAFQNISSGKVEDTYGYGSENHNPNSSPLKDPNLTEVNSQSELAQGKTCSESKPDMLPCSHVINDESSLGLTGIKWNDSLGPFDVGVSSLLRMINGESLSCSKSVR